MKGLGAVVSQRGGDSEIHVVAYASRSLHSSERSMRDYSSAKIEIMALKWAVWEKFKDYLLGSKFTVYTDKNPIVHIQKSKLGAAQIHWLSELVLYDFDIVYRTECTNLVVDVVDVVVAGQRIPILTMKLLTMRQNGLPSLTKQSVNY